MIVDSPVLSLLIDIVEGGFDIIFSILIFILSIFSITWSSSGILFLNEGVLSYDLFFSNELSYDSFSVSSMIFSNELSYYS